MNILSLKKEELALGTSRKRGRSVPRRAEKSPVEFVLTSLATVWLADEEGITY
jgi:hypothetical protein